MKNLLFCLLLLLGTTTASAQLIKEKEPVDPKYLAGGVPEVEGNVTFSHTFEVPASFSADSLYLTLQQWIKNYYNNDQTLKLQDILSDSINHRIELGVVEYMVFKSNALVLDRTQIIYMLKLSQKGNKLNVQMSQISYYYEEERTPEKYTAEEWITDKQALNRKGTKLLYGCGKFRTKTIDKFDEICKSLNFCLDPRMNPIL